MIKRRDVLIGTAAFGLMFGCAPAAGSLTVSATGSAGMNPGPDGADRPLTLHVLQLRGSGAFDGADFFALQDPATALGADLVKADQIVVTAGAPATKTIAIEAGTTLVGIVAGYRNPSGKSFRAKSAVSATGAQSLVIAIGPGGLTLRPA